LATHISSMLRRSGWPDLFADTERHPVKREQAAPLPVRLPNAEQLARLSEAELAELTILLSKAIRRRIESGSQLGSDLVKALEQFASVLPSSSTKKSAPRAETPLLLEGKRKAVKAALVAGIKPTQVARHFGLSLAEVRKVASEGASDQLP
jgi:hypothetical protein